MVDDPKEEPIEAVADAVEEAGEPAPPPPPEELSDPEDAFVSPPMADALSGEQVVFPMPQHEQAAVIASEG